MRTQTPRDPRLYQIAILTGLLIYGIVVLRLPVEAPVVVTILATALATQAVATRWLGLARFDPRSALISSLSLCLLLRTQSLTIAAAAAFIAIASKFLIRWRGRHLFNPTNLGLVVVTSMSDSGWISPGQWGSTVVVALVLGGAGVLVVSRAGTGDVTLALLTSYAALLFARALWLGDPWAIPLHRMHSAALFIFAFFMISDPKTTPHSRAGRVLFAVLVATGGVVVEWGFYRANGFLYSLALCALLVPFIDWLFPDRPYHWPGARKFLTRAPTTHRPAIAFAQPRSLR